MEKAHKIECCNRGDFAQRFRVVWKRGNSECRFYGPWSDEYSYPKSAVFRLTDIGLLSGDEVWIQVNPVFGSAQDAGYHVTCDLGCTAVARYILMGNMRNFYIDTQIYDEVIDTTGWSARCALTDRDRQVFDVATKGITDVKHTPVYVSYMVDEKDVHYLFYCCSMNEERKPADFYTAILVIKPLFGDRDAYVEDIRQIPVL